MPQLRSFVTSLSLRSLGFDHRPVRIGFMEEKVATGQVLVRVVSYSPLIIIP